jgi:hypothetical protein
VSYVPGDKVTYDPARGGRSIDLVAGGRHPSFNPSEGHWIVRRVWPGGMVSLCRPRPNHGERCTAPLAELERVTAPGRE